MNYRGLTPLEKLTTTSGIWKILKIGMGSGLNNYQPTNMLTLGQF